MEEATDFQWLKGKSTAAVKLEFEDDLDEAHGPLNKRSKLSTSQVCSILFASFYTCFLLIFVFYRFCVCAWMDLSLLKKGICRYKFNIN